MHPLEFPGGNIGELAVNGTVNDLAMVGARPLWLTAGFVIEEGFPVADLRRIVASMGAAARTAGVAVVAGDTKVVERGKADGLYVTTAGVGTLADGVDLGPHRVQPGDRVLLSGTLADHGMAVMVARGDLQLEAEIESDTAAVHELAAGARRARPGAALDARPDPRRARDGPERAGGGRRARRRPRRDAHCRYGPRSTPPARSSASTRSTSRTRAS